MEGKDHWGKLRKRIEQLKKKRPGYGEILDFYQKVREAQEQAKTSLKVETIRLGKDWKELFVKEGFSVVQREDFPIDLEVSARLFRSLCQIAEEANSYLSDKARRIEEAVANKKVDLRKLLSQAGNQAKVEEMADGSGLDKKILLFLIQNSARPSIEVGREQLSHEQIPGTSPKGFCPACGSPPHLSLLKEEVGKRFLLCSYCGYQWQTDRLICAFCGNKDQESLYYLHAEGEEPYRLDLCDKCHQYIKTIDLRKIEAIDPFLEDLATPHLDLLASKKGYKRPVPNPWTT